MFELAYRYRQVIKFGIVGVLNTLISFVLIFVFDKVIGLPYTVANPLAYLGGTINSFYLNRKWTFRSGGKLKKEGSLFFAVMGVAWLIQYGLLYYMVEKLQVDDMIAQAIGMVIFTGLNFAGQKFVAFKGQ